MSQGFDPRKLVAGVFPHPVAKIQVIETHISWVVLTGSFAYKFKKPVNFGFLDFSSLEKRRKACEQELRLNLRTAPGIYLGLVVLVESGDGLALVEAGDNPELANVVEFGVRMLEFAQSSQLDRQFEAGRLGGADMDRVAATIAALHESAAIADAGQPWGDPETVVQPARENFRHLYELAPNEGETLDQIKHWSEAEFAAHQSLFRQRKLDGRVRECHGDLHLSNLVRIGSEILAFDCIEFDPALRWIDVLSDVAFLHMDLAVRQRADLAFRFLNAYLERGGDYAGAGVLPFYISYRSMVRAKVAALQLLDEGLPEEHRHGLDQRRELHIRFARSLIGAAKPTLVLMHGLSGSGKTWLSQQLLECLPALRIRSDVERKRLHGMSPDADTHSGQGAGIYSDAATRHTYSHLLANAGAMLSAGIDVIVDAAFLDEGRMDSFVQLASQRRLDCVIVACEAPLPLLRKRLVERGKNATDASEADLGVLHSQLRGTAAAPVESTARIVRVDTSQDVDIPGLCRSIKDCRHG